MCVYGWMDEGMYGYIHVHMRIFLHLDFLASSDVQLLLGQSLLSGSKLVLPIQFTKEREKEREMDVSIIFGDGFIISARLLDGRSALSRNNDLKMTLDPKSLHQGCADARALSIVMVQLWGVINYDRWASIERDKSVTYVC